MCHCSTQLSFTQCEKSSDNQNNCTVEDPFSMSSDGVLIIKVNGSNAVASTSTAEQRIQLHDIGQYVIVIQFLKKCSCLVIIALSNMYDVGSHKLSVI